MFIGLTEIMDIKQNLEPWTQNTVTTQPNSGHYLIITIIMTIGNPHSSL